MCCGFGCIVNAQLQLYFTEPDENGDCSHSLILTRLNIPDKEIYNRKFVRLEADDWKVVVFDEIGTLPGWAMNNQEEIFNRAQKLMERVRKVFAPYLENRKKKMMMLGKLELWAWEGSPRRYRIWSRIKHWVEPIVLRPGPEYKKAVEALYSISGYIPKVKV